MPIPKEFSVTNVPEEQERIYVPPQAGNLSIESIDRATSCACKAADDNPY